MTFTIHGTNDVPTIVGETNPLKQTVVTLGPVTPIVLGPGVITNALGLNTETFDNQGQSLGSVSNNGDGSFSSAALGATFSESGHAGVVHGSSSVSAAPFVGPLPGQADITNYLSIGAGGKETISFAHDQNALGCLGLVDSYKDLILSQRRWLLLTGRTLRRCFRPETRVRFRQTGMWSSRA